MNGYLNVFFSRSMLLVLLTGFSSGLPLALTAGTLQAWMSDEKIELTVIGIFSLVGLPYTIKFLWAPLMDRFVPPFLGRRRGWMLISQIFLLLSIAALGCTHPAKHPELVAALALLIAFFSASQDIVIDAFRTDLLCTEERGAGASISNFGYRMAMIVSGAVALVLADHLSWKQVYFLMASLMSIGIVATFLATEPRKEVTPPQSLQDAIMAPLLSFFKRVGAVEILIFILIYKIDIVMAVALMTKFMLELGFSKTEIGAVTKTVGMIAAIVGSLVGGALYVRLGMKRSLWYFGILQGFSTLTFALLAEVGKNNLVMAGAVGFENFCAGLATAPFIAFLMSLCDARFTATQYALLSSFAAVSRVVAGAPTGYLVLAVGWTQFFVVCALTAIPGLLLIRFRFDRWSVK